MIAMEAPAVVHADGTLTVAGGAVQVEVTKGGGYRGTITVPLERCTLRVMGRAIAVFDEGRLVHLCSRCKPAAEVAKVVAQLGDRATLEPRTPFATLLALREESAGYRPEGAVAPAPETGAAEGEGDGEGEGEAAALEVPAGYESLRRVYLSRAAMARDSRRLRAAGWTAHQVSVVGEEEQEAPRPGGLRRLLRAASPSREAGEGFIVWIRPVGDSPER